MSKKKKSVDVVIDGQTPDEPARLEGTEERAASQAEGDGVVIDMQALRAEVAQIVKERDEAVERMKYVTADFDNFRKRNVSARADASSEATRAAVAAFLPAIDNLERALAAAQNGETGALTTGVDMVLKQMFKIIGDLGVEEIASQCGDPFDPEVHNAIVTVPSDQEHKDNTVFDTLQKGYKHEGKVIRYAMVRVAKDG